MERFELLKKYIGWILVVIIGIAFYKMFDGVWAIFDFITSVLSTLRPLFLGAVLAYFLSPLAVMLEKQLEKTPKLKKHRRIISVLTVFFGLLAIIVIFLIIVLPIVTNAVIELTAVLPSYFENIEPIIRQYTNNDTIVEFILGLENYVIQFFEDISKIDPLQYAQSALSAINVVITTILGFIFCPYILIERDRLSDLFDRIALLFIKLSTLQTVRAYTDKSHVIFGKFIYGKFIDSIIIGLIAAVGFWLLGLPVFPLLAFIIFITNIIPYFGPFIGAVPVIGIVLLTGDVMLAFWTGVFILALQQFDGLVLGPAILGESVGITPFWIITAITLFGGLWGFVGMFIGVPLICIIRILFNDYSAYRNKKE